MSIRKSPRCNLVRWSINPYMTGRSNAEPTPSQSVDELLEQVLCPRGIDKLHDAFVVDTNCLRISANEVFAQSGYETITSSKLK
jgi:hypothetical protein